jgi:hypothetical protein
MLFWFIILVCYIILPYCISILFFTIGRFEHQYIDSGVQVCTTAVGNKNRRAS